MPTTTVYNTTLEKVTTTAIGVLFDTKGDKDSTNLDLIKEINDTYETTVKGHKPNKTITKITKKDSNIKYGAFWSR